MTRQATLAILAALALSACRQEAAPSAPAAPAAPEAPAVVAEPAAAPADLKPGAELSVTHVETGAAVGHDLRVITEQNVFSGH